MSTSLTPLQALANAQAQEEGFNVNGSLPQRLANPGDLEDSSGNLIDFSGQPAGTGMAALISKLQNIASGNSSVYSPSMSLQQFEDTYTGTPGTNAASNVASMLGGGTTPSTPLGNLLGASGLPGTASGASSGTGTPASSGSGFGSNALNFLTEFFGGSDPLDTSQYLIRGVAVLGGLVLIAGAVFGFDKVQETAINITKKGAEAATMAAA